MLNVVDEDLRTENGEDVVASKLLHMELSECAFYGTSAKQSVQTMKVEGLVRNQTVRILLDSRSTHNFLDFRLAKKWSWVAEGTQAFEVVIANGGKIKGSGCYKDVSLLLSGYE